MSNISGIVDDSILFPIMPSPSQFAFLSTDNWSLFVHSLQFCISVIMVIKGTLCSFNHWWRC